MTPFAPNTLRQTPRTGGLVCFAAVIALLGACGDSDANNGLIRPDAGTTVTDTGGTGGDTTTGPTDDGGTTDAGGDEGDTIEPADSSDTTEAPDTGPTVDDRFIACSTAAECDTG